MMFNAVFCVEARMQDDKIYNTQVADRVQKLLIEKRFLLLLC